MIPRDFPELSLAPVELLPVGPRYRRRGGPVLRSLPDRLLFGGPLAVPIDPEDVHDDPDLLAFVYREAPAVRYALVHSALSFSIKPGDPPLESATVEMRLCPGAPDVLAWSLLPMLAAMPYEAKSRFTLGPSLEFLGVEAGVGSVTRERTVHGADVFLRASGPMTANAKWDFKRTSTVELVGAHPLTMVVRCAGDGPAHLEVTLSASVKSGRGPRRFKKVVELPGAEGATRELPLCPPGASIPESE